MLPNVQWLVYTIQQHLSYLVDVQASKIC